MTDDLAIDLEYLYALSANEENDAALDLIFEAFDAAANEGRFDRVNDVLRAIDVQRLNLTLLLGLISSSYTFHERLDRACLLQILQNAEDLVIATERLPVFVTYFQRMRKSIQGAAP